MADRRICAVEGCDKGAKRIGWCRLHHERWQRHGDPTAGRASPRTGCDVPGCYKPHEARGYCSSHYDKWKKYADPMGGVLTTKAGEPARFLLANVSHNSDECLIWPFSRYASGYGQIADGHQAHRKMCILAHGEPPSTKHEAAHSCGKGHEGCVNPRHLRWATPTENQADKVAHGTTNRGERCGAAKLTEAEVRAIRALEGQMTQQGIADKFGVHLMTVNNILRRRNWRWLE